MESLLLTDSEQKLFQELPEALRQEWQVKTQEALQEESAAQLVLRYKMAHFTDQKLQEVVNSLRGDRSKDAVEKALRMIDLRLLSQGQIAELFFILGIAVMNQMVSVLLRTAETDEDLEGVAGITHIRFALHEANLSNATR